MAEKPTYEELEKRVKELEKKILECNPVEEELRDSNEKLTALFQSSPMAIISLDSDGNVTFWNPAAEKMFGWKEKEAIGRFLPFVSEEAKSEHHALRHRVLSGEGFHGVEALRKKKDGSDIYISISTVPLKDSTGSISGIMTVIVDITERKKTKEALSNSHQIIEGIINTIPVRVFWKDKNLVFLGCNELFAHDAGFADPKDIIEKDDYQMVWCDQAELYRGDDRQVIESGTSKLLIEEPQTTPEGNTITLLTSKIPLRSPTGEIIGVLGTYMDITKRKQAEAALRASEEKYRLLVKNITSIVYKGYKDWSVEFFDNKIELIVGYTADEFNSKRMKWNDIIVEEDIETARESFVKALKTDKSYVREYRINSKAGDIQWIQERGYIVCDNKGEIDSVSGVFFNITDLKQAEEALKTSRENLLEESNQRKILSKRLIDLLEKDRHDIAMELHDNIGQILTSLKIYLEIVDDKLKPIDTELGSLTKAAIKRANQAINDLNNIAHGLMPSILDPLGLVSSLRSLLNEFREHTDIKKERICWWRYRFKTRKTSISHRIQSSQIQLPSPLDRP